MDNAYTFIVTLKHLYRHNICAAGTIRANRKFLPQDIKKPPRLTRGQHKNFQDTDNPFFTFTVWMDVKCVHFTGSFHKPHVTGVPLRRIGREYVEVSILYVEKGKSVSHFPFNYPNLGFLLMQTQVRLIKWKM